MDNQYFTRFPTTLYTNDNKKTIQIIRDITRRASVLQKSITNLNMFEEIDVDDGSPVWVVADIYYNDPELYWVILMTNDILDPRFEWPMDNRQLMTYTKNKYQNVNGHHHYENSEMEIINGEITIFPIGLDFLYLSKDDLVLNKTGEGSAIILDWDRKKGSVLIKTMKGGIIHEDTIEIFDTEGNSQIVELRKTEPGDGVIPITNWLFEVRKNEERRRIKILKPQFVNRFVGEFTAMIET